MDFSQAPGLLQPLPEPPKSTVTPRTSTNPWKGKGQPVREQQQPRVNQSKRSVDYRSSQSQDVEARQIPSAMRRRPAQQPMYWAKFENFPAGSPLHELKEFFGEMELNVSNLTTTNVNIKGHERVDAECSLPNHEELDKCLTQLNEMQYIENVLRVTDISAIKKNRQFSPVVKEGRTAAGVGWYRGMITKTAAGRETIRPPPLEVYSPPQEQNRYESRFHAPVRRGRNFPGRQMGNRGPMQQTMQQQADAEGFSRVKPNRRNRREGRRSGSGFSSRFGGSSGGQQAGGGRFSGLRSRGQSNRRQQNRLRQDRGSSNRSFGSGRQQPDITENKSLNKPQKRPQNRFAAFIDAERIRDEE